MASDIKKPQQIAERILKKIAYMEAISLQCQDEDIAAITAIIREETAELVLFLIKVECSDVSIAEHVRIKANNLLTQWEE